MKWEEKYRPRKFGDVHGQDHVVQLVSGLIRNNKAERNIALIGAVGSGKTSLVNLYARGMNCSNVEADGSPCGRCEFCKNPGQYLHEYDTAGLSGSRDDILAFVRAKIASVGAAKTQVVFFDEAHALAPAAQDALLISIEQARKGLVFCLATTERKSLKPALLSRFVDLDVLALSHTTALEYLESVAAREELSVETEALRLLVASRPPHARDLIIALESLSHLNRHLDVEIVKKHYDLGVCDHLPRYMRALASGVRADELKALVAWLDSGAAKRNWIERFISATYYNEILGVEYIDDQMVHYLVSARREFVDLLRTRFALDADGLRAVFESMMEFWSLHNPPAGSDVNLSIALFGTLVSRGLSNLDEPGRKPADGIAASAEPTESRLMGTVSDPAATVAYEEQSQFIDANDLGQIINRASFFVQHYGRPLNASACFEFAGNIPDADTAANDGIIEVLKRLENSCDRSDAPFACIATLERDGGMIVGRLVAHLDGDLLGEFGKFCRSWPSASSHIIDYRACHDRASMAFQHTAIRDLCAGCAPYGTTVFGDVRRKLGIAREMWRNAGPSDCSHVFISGRLSDPAIEEACSVEMRPLSAFDAGAWKWVFSGWEMKEFSDRRNELTRRLNEQQSLKRRWKQDQSRSNLEVAAQLEAWGRILPEQRTRRWRGWW